MHKEGIQRIHCVSRSFSLETSDNHLSDSCRYVVKLLASLALKWLNGRPPTALERAPDLYDRAHAK